MVTRENFQPVAIEHTPASVLSVDDARMQDVANSVELDIETLDIHEPGAQDVALQIEQGEGTGHPIEIIPGEVVDPKLLNRILAKFPLPDDPTSDGGVSSMIHQLLPQVISYIQLPEVEDRWGQDEDSRKAWEIQVAKEYGHMGKAIISSNRLRSNPMGWAASAIDTLSAVIPALREDLAEDLMAAFPMIDSRVFETRLMTDEEKAQSHVDLSTVEKQRAAEKLTTPVYRWLPLEEKRKIAQSVIDASTYLLDVLDNAPAVAQPVVGFGPHVLPSSGEEANVA